ncbi:nisG [Streptococcus salivarius]|uniref:nisG n=1 Tax=Streptococcus salivarius TaxID=1304 RepID=UPI000E53AB84|nr:nisG [Streptococcus salivarius]RGS20221.1 nisG [Streptococcus salivarius]
MLRSELLKLKNTFGLYLILSITVLEIITIPMYVSLVSNVFSLTNLAILSFLFYPLLTVFLSILGIEQEKHANQYQEISSYPKKRRLWLAKLLIADLILGLPSIFSWLIINLLLMNSVNGFVVSLSSWMLMVFLNHFHYFIQVSLNSASNIIISINEIIFIIFASNKVFLSIHWLPIALPINSLILSDWSQLNSLPLWIVGVTLLLICFIDYRTKR